MAARSSVRVLGCAPGAAGIKEALHSFRSGGRGVVTALNLNLLRCAADLMAGDEEIRPLSFGEIIKECLSLCDEEAKNQASQGLYVAAIARACDELDADSIFSRSARFFGFHRAVAETWNELHRWGLTADHLDIAADKSSGTAAEKFRSMAQLDREADETLTSLGFETVHSQMRRALECKPAKDGKLPRTLVLAGSEVQPLAAQFLRWMAENGADVWVVIEPPLADSNLFQGAGTFMNAVGSLMTETTPHPNALCEVLFTDQEADGKPWVRINSCSDVLAEAEWALRGCLGDIQLGLAYEDIVIYARDIDGYACPLEASAKRLDIPIRLSRRAPVLTNRFARLVLEALEFCASDDPRTIIPLLSCSYLGLDRKTADDIRSQARLAYKAKANAWPVFIGWAEGHAQEFSWLARMLHWRSEASGLPQSLRSWTNRLQALIDILPWHNSSSEGPTRSRDMRIPAALRRAIRNIASVRSIENDSPMPLQDFARLCREVWSDEEYFIPSEGRGIAVVNSAQCIGDVKSVYAVGMLEGVFPRRRREDPILTDEDRKQISEALSLEPPLMTSLDHASEERDEFYRLCAAARESITLSYPQADDTRDNVPAFYLHEVERAMKTVSKHDYPRVPFAPVEAECVAPSDRELRQALNAPREDALPVYFSTKEVKDHFAWPVDEAFSPRDIRDALQCEFRHFASKRLGLKPNRESSRWSRLQGIPRAVRLLQQSDINAAKQALEAALDAELDQVYGDIPDWEMAMMRSGGRRLLAEWLQREFAARKLWPKESDTLKVDMPFGAPGIRDRMPGDVPLRGTVAGVSRMGPYAVTHLYEGQPPNREGAVESGPLSELDALYYGLHLLARHGQGKGMAVEVESMHGTRTLLVMPRLAEMPLPSRRQDGLEVIDLSGGADGPFAQKAFFDEVKRRLKKAVHRLQQSGIEPIRGEHCKWCGYGELCRRSLDFSEEDSVFGTDENEFEDD